MEAAPVQTIQYYLGAATSYIISLFSLYMGDLMAFGGFLLLMLRITQEVVNLVRTIRNKKDKDDG